MDIIDEEESSNSPGTSNYFANLNNLNHPTPLETATENGESTATNLWVDLTFGGDVCLFACLWGDCQQRFAEREIFEAHMETHLANYANQLIMSNNGWLFIIE